MLWSISVKIGVFVLLWLTLCKYFDCTLTAEKIKMLLLGKRGWKRLQFLLQKFKKLQKRNYSFLHQAWKPKKSWKSKCHRLILFPMLGKPCLVLESKGLDVDFHSFQNISFWKIFFSIFFLAKNSSISKIYWDSSKYIPV